MLKTVANYIAQNNKIERIENKIMGKEIDEARDILGYWWTQRDASYSRHGGYQYHYVRPLNGDITIHTNRDNIVVEVTGYWTPRDEQNNEYL